MHPRPLDQRIGGVDAVVRTLGPLVGPDALVELRFAVADALSRHDALRDAAEDGRDPAWLLCAGVLDAWPADLDCGLDELGGNEMLLCAATTLGRSPRPGLLADAACDALAALERTGDAGHLPTLVCHEVLSSLVLAALERAL